MIAGGYNFSELATVEVLGENIQKCKLPDLPKVISYIPTLLKHDHNILVCGGQRNEKSCLRLDGDRWVHFNDMLFERKSAATVSVKGANYIFGGKASKTSTEILMAGSNEWTEGLQIPKGAEESCSVRVSNQDLLIIGGADTPYRIKKFNYQSQTWTDKLSVTLSIGRKDLACASFNSKVVVAGGRHEGISLHSTEVLDLNTMKIRPGGNMTVSRYRPGMGTITWQGKPTLIVFGGRVSNREFLDSVEAWNDATETWILLPELRLKEPKMSFGYITLPTEIICANKED